MVSRAPEIHHDPVEKYRKRERDLSSSPLSILSRTPSPPSDGPSPGKPASENKTSLTVSEKVAPVPTEQPTVSLKSSPKLPCAIPPKPTVQASPSLSNTVAGEAPRPEKTAASRSSGRNRKAPIHFQHELNEEVDTDGSQIKKVKLSQSNVGRKRLPVRGNWSPEFLLQNAQSKLATINLMELLSSDRAWTSLERDQQLKLISMLPNASLPDWPESEDLPNVPMEFLKTNRSMQADVRLFQEDLKEGRHEPSWQRSAAEAMEKRANGDFDDWKERNREEFWGQKQKTIKDARAGDSAKYSLEDLVAAGCFEVGDAWNMRRTMGHGKNSVVVEKEATLTSISANNTLGFTFPPGNQKHSIGRMDVELGEVASPKTLSDAIIRQDGQIPSTSRGANAWLEFRCVRRNQDLGSIWDIRELHHHRQSAH